MSIPPEITAVIIAFFLGPVSNIIWDEIKSRKDKEKLLMALKTELVSILTLQEKSAYMILPKPVWEQLNKSGIFFKLDSNLRTHLLQVYASIEDKNNQVTIRNSNIGTTITLADGENKFTDIHESISALTKSIRELTQRTIQLLDKEIGVGKRTEKSTVKFSD